MWLGVDLGTGTRPTCVLRDWIPFPKCVNRSRFSSQCNLGDLYDQRSFNEHKNIVHFDSERLWVSYQLKDHEANGYKHDLDLVVILHYLCVSCPTRNGCKERNIHLMVPSTLMVKFHGRGIAIIFLGLQIPPLTSLLDNRQERAPFLFTREVRGIEYKDSALGDSLLFSNWQLDI